MNAEFLDLSLLDVLQLWAGCMYLSDLRYVDRVQRRRLAEKLKALPPGACGLREWKDALEYLSGEKAASSSAEQARDELIAALDKPIAREGCG